MKKSNKKNIIIASIILGLILISLIVGLIIYTYPSSLKLQNTVKGRTMEATFYDSNGNIYSSSTKQTTIGTQSGIFYMRLKVLISNTGNTLLYNLSVNSITPSELNIAMQNQNPSVSNISVGQSNIVILDSANSCSTDSDCGSSEKCILPSGQSQKICVMDISNLIGQKIFGVTINANYRDAYGNVKSTSSTVNLAYNFSQDQVIFRTNNLNYGSTSTQIAVDSNGDGNLEAYTFNSAGSSAFYPANFLSYTPGKNLVYKDGANIAISQATGLDKTITQTNVAKWTYSSGGTISTSKSPIEPFTSTNCGGTKPCQEVYSIAVAAPTQTCGNNLIEGTELCDGTSLNSNTCVSIGQGFTSGTLGCSSDCTTWVTSSCSSPSSGTKVTFRTSDLGYGSTSAIAFDVSASCPGTSLTAFGYSTGTGTLTGNCDAKMPSISAGSCSGTNNLVYVVIPGEWMNGGDGPSLWKNSVSGVYCICDDDGTHYMIKKYTSGSSYTNNVDKSGNSINSNNEIPC